MLSRLVLPTFILSTLLVALADPILTGPSPGQLFNEGSNCTVTWTPDPTGIWKSLDIELMTGDNLQMKFLTTVASGIDGTASPGTLSFPCPNVTPNSAIYFIQLSSVASTNLTWSGRFAIASSTGATVPPQNPTQPDGEVIPWGTGALTDPTTAVPAPSYLSAARNTTTTNSTSVSSTVTSSSSSSVLSTTTPTQSPSSVSSGSPAAATGTSSSNSAGGLVVGAVSMRAAQAGVALSVIAATFTFFV